MSGPEEMTTWCPACWAAFASGIIGSRWPYAGQQVKRIFISTFLPGETINANRFTVG